MRSSKFAVGSVLLVAGLLLSACASAATPAAPATSAPIATASPVPATSAPTVEATTSASSSATGPAMIKVGQNDQLGQFLTDDKGRTLYIFLSDSANTSTCYDSCAQTWPAFTTKGNPTGGEGVDAKLLGTTARSDGSQQVTYKQQPLYYFAADVNPGDTNGEGIGDVWYVVSPQGEKVVK